MSPSSFIGRIGGLAAALGIGAAVFSVPGVAWPRAWWSTSWR